MGDRSAENARALRERIPPGYRCRATRSNFWLAYAEVFPTPVTSSVGTTPLRQRLGRFVRKTLSYSKGDRMHELALPLCTYEYNQHPVV